MQALSHAGHQVTTPANVAVAVGIASAEYNNHLVAIFASAVSAYSATGGAQSVASGRLSYMFAFKGPAISIDTACSSSLVATHVATNAIGSGGSTAALTAGIGLLMNPNTTAMFQKAGMLAPDGRCKSLDVSADGYVRGESAGVLFFSVSPNINQPIAIFMGSAINQDGRSSSLTAPNGPSQQEVMKSALHLAEAIPAEIAHLEMHGTGTALGDPIEIGAAHAVLVEGGNRRIALAANTAKSIIGHTEAAAGAMGVAHTSAGVSYSLVHGKVGV